MFQQWLRALAVVVLIAVAGCGDKTDTVKVTGVLLLENAPLANASITFINVGDGPPAMGLTDRQGNFELTTYRSRDGAKPGTYKIIVKVEDPPAGAGGAPMNAKDPDAMTRYKEQQSKKDLEPAKEAAPLIHPNYTRADKTPLKETIPAPGPVTILLKKNGL